MTLTLSPFFALMIHCWPGQTSAATDKVLVLIGLSALTGFVSSVVHRLITGRNQAQGFWLVPMIGNHQIVHFSWNQLWLSKACNFLVLLFFVLACDLSRSWWDHGKPRTIAPVLHDSPDDTP